MLEDIERNQSPATFPLQLHFKATQTSTSITAWLEEANFHLLPLLSRIPHVIPQKSNTLPIKGQSSYHLSIYLSIHPSIDLYLNIIVYIHMHMHIQYTYIITYIYIYTFSLIYSYSILYSLTWRMGEKTRCKASRPAIPCTSTPCHDLQVISHCSRVVPATGHSAHLGGAGENGWRSTVEPPKMVGSV